MYFKWIWIRPWMKLHFPLANWVTERMQDYLKQGNLQKSWRILIRYLPSWPPSSRIFPLFVGACINKQVIDIFWPPNRVDERMQNNQMNKILIETVQRTAPKFQSSKSFQQKNQMVSQLQIRRKSMPKWKIWPQIIPNQVNYPQKSTPNHHTIPSNPSIFPIASGYPPWTSSLYPHVFPCSVATGSGAAPPVRQPSWRAGNGPLIPTAGAKSVDVLRCTWGFYMCVWIYYIIFYNIWYMIYVKSWCKLIFYKYAGVICWFMYFLNRAQE